jgi:hypothetical protein
VTKSDSDGGVNVDSVLAESCVGGYEGHLLDGGLGHQDTVVRISMMPGHGIEVDNVSSPDGDDRDLQTSDILLPPGAGVFDGSIPFLLLLINSHNVATLRA